MICLKHQQQYSEGQYCIYCGNPNYIKAGNSLNIAVTLSKDYNNIFNETNTCPSCGLPKPVGEIICSACSDAKARLQKLNL